MSEVTWRSAEPADAAGLLDLFAAITRSAPVGLETVLADVQARLDRPQLDLRRDTQVAVDTSGAMLAYAEATDMGVGQGQFRVRLTSAIHPDVGLYAGEWAQSWLVARAAQMREERQPDLPGVLGTRCAAVDRDRLALLTRSGFEIVQWELDLIRRLGGPLPAVPTPAGVVIVPYQARYDEAARIAHNDAYADSPGALLPDVRSWPQHAVGLPSFLPDASFLALTDDAAGHDIIASLFSLEYHDVTGVGEGGLNCLATRKPWRRHGVAGALICGALAAYQQAGYGQARLQVRDSNTDAMRLYTRLGFADSVRGYAIMHAPLP